MLFFLSLAEGSGPDSRQRWPLRFSLGLNLVLLGHPFNNQLRDHAARARQEQGGIRFRRDRQAYPNASAAITPTPIQPSANIEKSCNTLRPLIAQTKGKRKALTAPMRVYLTFG